MKDGEQEREEEEGCPSREKSSRSAAEGRQGIIQSMRGPGQL